ncbi:30S ribosomal protein S6 [Treponema sp. R6D11]
MEKLNAYESFLVVDATKTKEQTDEIVSKFRELIKANATLDGEDVWGRRKLAYEINHKSEGFYVLFYFTCDGSFPAELERQYRITDGVLRFLIVRNEDGFKPDLSKSLAPRDGAPAKKAAEEKPSKAKEEKVEEVVEEVVVAEIVAEEIAETVAEEIAEKMAAIPEEEPDEVDIALMAKADAEAEEEKPKAKKAPAKKPAAKKTTKKAEEAEEKPAKKAPAKKATAAKKTAAKKTAKEAKDAE